MPLVFPSQGFLNPQKYLGTYVNENPSYYSEGNWWYRVDLGTIYTYINGQVLPTISSSATVIDSNATYTNTTFTEDVVILPNVTVTIYGNVTFAKNLIILGTLQSSNPNASSSSKQNNYYDIGGVLVIQGTYSVSPYNYDNINSQSTNLQIFGQGTITGGGQVNLPSNVYINDSFNVGNVIIYNTTLNIKYTINITGNAFLSAVTLTAPIININSGVTLYISDSTFSFSTNSYINGGGTIYIYANHTLTFAGNFCINIPTITGGGYIKINNTICITSNVTFDNINTVSGANISINSGYTLTINGNITFSITGLGTAGTLSINSGYTLIINNNVNINVNIAGAGTLTINSGYTLTQSANITISIPTININGTWANSGYTITVPSGATVTFNQSGSLTTGSTAGTLTVNGTVYWYGGAIGTSTASNGIPSFPLTINGTGIFIGSPTNGGTATTTISLSSTSLTVGGYTSSVTSSGGKVYAALSTINGNTAGKYGLGYYDTTAATYLIWILVYIGTTNTNFTVSGSFGANQSDTSGDNTVFYNSNGSAGTITLTGTVYL